ncbi:MAG TPA: protein-L-isoaspartate(D-aspartate) O-methyltransferase [Acidimicrobiia bacterium]
MVGRPDLSEEEQTRRRHLMVERQIRRRGIGDPRILEAMETVPRHRFVPARLQSRAYDDGPLPIGDGQTISQPYIVARMAEMAEIHPDDRVLDVGTGSGYAAAVYSRLCRELVSIEIRPELAEAARRRLAELGYRNVTVITGGLEAVADEQPFDAILVAAAAPRIPEKLEKLLAEGGRLVIPVGSTFSQRLWTVRRRDGKLERERHELVAFVPLVD